MVLWAFASQGIFMAVPQCFLTSRLHNLISLGLKSLSEFFTETIAIDFSRGKAHRDAAEMNATHWATIYSTTREYPRQL